MLASVVLRDGALVHSTASGLIRAVAAITGFVADLRQRYALIPGLALVLRLLVTGRVVDTFCNWNLLDKYG